MHALLAVSLLLLPTGVSQQGPRILTPGQMEEDLFFLIDRFERDHGGLVRYGSRAEIEAAYGAAFEAIQGERTTLAFYRILARLVATIRCGHTRVRYEGRERLRALDRAGVLPIEVHLVGERVWVKRTLADGVPLEPGQEILAIDGVGVPEIRARAFAMLFSDGFNETAKERELERRFAEHLVLLIDDQATAHPEREVTVAGSDEPVRVRSITGMEWDGRPDERDPRPIVHLGRAADDVGLLDVRGFRDPADGTTTFPELLAACFVELEQEGIPNLILDLRGNGGGDDTYGALLVSYMTQEPFGYFDRIEVTEDYEGPGGIVERDGVRCVSEHPGLQVQEPAAHAFTGKVVILTDGWTFSTAADVATVAHHNGLATFVGEETGGGYDGNTSGVSRGLSLPNSGIAARVPCWMYTTANVGHAYPGRGVPPDHHVRPTIEDVLAERDPELALALGLFRAD